MNLNKRIARVAVLLAMVGWSLIAPQPAQAQFGGSLIVTVTSPASGSTVSGAVPVSASVSGIGALTVRGVQFKLDGNNLGAEDTTAPYSVSWNTTAASNGSHTLTAVARDSLGMLWTSDPVTVTVFNDTTPPTVSITSPASGTIVAGTISVTASASDVVGGAGRHADRARDDGAGSRRGNADRRRRGVVEHRDRDRVGRPQHAKRISRHRGQRVGAVARGGGVPGDRVGRGRVFRAEVVAVQLELHSPDGESTDTAYAGADWHRAADGGSGSRGRDGDDQAAHPQLRLGRLRRDQAPADHRQQDCYASNSIIHVHSRVAALL